MKIGMPLTSSYPLTQDSRLIMDNLVEEVKPMAQLGFDSFSLGDHHLTPNHYVQVLPAISSLSAVSGGMRLPPLFLLPFYNPILLAKQTAGETPGNYGRSLTDVPMALDVVES